MVCSVRRIGDPVADGLWLFPADNGKVIVTLGPGLGTFNNMLLQFTGPAVGLGLLLPLLIGLPMALIARL